MNTFAAAVEIANSESNLGETANGMAAHASSLNPLTDLFFVIGSARGKDISSQFRAAYHTDAIRTLQMLFWARDVRGGAGERDTFRKLLRVLEVMCPTHAMQLIPLVPEYGRWDDLDAFETSTVREKAITHWAGALVACDALAAKWAPRKGPLANELRKCLGVSPKAYRKLIVNLTQVVETQMCAQQWDQITYAHVPSVAHSRYAKAFGRHDGERYGQFKEAALKGDVNINSHALYPYDVLRALVQGDLITAQAQWQNLPNYLGPDHHMILPMIDTSGSMSTQVGGQKGKGLSCMDVAISLGLYLADKQQGPFANMFLNFDARSHIHNLQGDLVEKYMQISNCAWGGNTNLENAFKEVLRVAIQGNVCAHEMPKYILVISDMGYDSHTGGVTQTAHQMARDIYSRYGYECPSIIWWNVAHRAGGYGGDNNYPTTHDESGTAMISGFSPSIMKSVLSCSRVTPFDVMMLTLNQPRYEAVREALSHVT